jgi:hypothetical protein
MCMYFRRRPPVVNPPVSSISTISLTHVFTIVNLSREGVKMRLGIAAVLLWCITLLFPAGAGATKYAGEFMFVGGGARALGMGGAFAAVAGDASTIFWNPAGVSGLEGRQALAMHSERFGQLVNYNFAAYMQPTNLLGADREAGFGFALQHLGIDDIPVTKDLPFTDVDGDGVWEPLQGDELDTSNVPLESDNSLALLSTFAMNTQYGRIGGTLKLIYTNSIAGYSSTGIGIDLGYLFRGLWTENLDIGVKLRDITGTYISWSSGHNEFILPMVKLGAAYTIKSKPMNGSLLLALDSDFYFENYKTASQFWAGSTSADLHAGAELRFQEKVMVRGGLDSGNWTAGAGLQISFLGFDYAYLHHDDFEATHRISILANF